MSSIFGKNSEKVVTCNCAGVKRGYRGGGGGVGEMFLVEMCDKEIYKKVGWSLFSAIG